MSITLSSSDLDQATRTMRLLTSPFDHDTTDGWRSAVNRQLRELLHADSAGFLLPAGDGPAVYSEEHDPEALARYPDTPPPPRSDGTSPYDRLLHVGVARLEELYEGEFDIYLNSAYYNDYAGANGAHDTLAAGLPLPGADGLGMAALLLWHGRPDGRLFGDRETALLRLLFPAFRAGVESHVRWGARRDDLLHALDSLRQAAVICDLSGRTLHQTPALETLLDADPDAWSLRAEIRAAVRDVCRAARVGSRSSRRAAADAFPAALTRDVHTHTARYHLQGCLYGGREMGHATYVLVGLERLTAEFPALDTLRDRLGLTRRQAEVALLLARRKSNDEIADALCISPHTARHHTEATLRTLGVRDRREVEARLHAAVRVED